MALCIACWARRAWAMPVLRSPRWKLAEACLISRDASRSLAATRRPIVSPASALIETPRASRAV